MPVFNFVIAPIHTRIGKTFIAKGEMHLEFPPLPPPPKAALEAKSANCSLSADSEFDLRRRNPSEG